MAARRPLTERQRGVLEAIQSYHREHGFPATTYRLAELVGGSQSAVVSIVYALARRGHLHQVRDGTAVRYLPVVEEGCCPCCGRKLEEALNEPSPGVL